MIDGEARDVAAHDFDRNVVVRAGAGTGKTSLLVERVICQMVARDLDVDQFAAITFTEKAAAEMRKRLAESLAALVALATAAAPPVPGDDRTASSRAYAYLRGRAGVPSGRIVEIAQKRLRDLVRADISTIHAFCAGLLRRYPLQSGVDPGFAVDTGTRFEELQVEVWRELLAGSDGPEGISAPVWRSTLSRLDLAELEQIGRACASFALPFEAVERGLPHENAHLTPRVDAALRDIDACVAGTPAKGPESWLDAARDVLVTLRDGEISAFRAALESARCIGGNGKERDLLSTDAPKAAANARASDLAKSVHRTLTRLRLVDDALLDDAVALVRPFAREVRNRARLRGMLPFDALLSLTRDLLRAHPDVRRELGTRYTALFLDEFQDTDPLQYEIVFLLAEDPTGAQADDPWATRLGSGRLFIVGDPKQAIYRFRGADISAYLQAIEHVEKRNGGVLVDLITNFRARPEVLAPIDRLFAPLLDPPPDASESVKSAYSGYQPLVSGLTATGERRVEVWTVGASKDERNAAEGRQAEADAIAAWIVTEIAAGRLRAGQIAILLRALKDVHVYARAIQDRGVQVLIGRSEELELQAAGQQILALLRALANPADAPAVIAVLRSPIGAVSDAELARWVAGYGGHARAGAWSYPDVTPSPADLPNVARAFALLRALREASRTLAPVELLAALVERTPLLAIHQSASDGDRRVADFWLLIERLVEVARATPGLSLTELVQGLDTDERRPVPDDGDDASDRVQLSSIHGAKGLEFPVVILPDLARDTRAMIENFVEVKLLRGVSDARGLAAPAPVLALTTRAAISSSWLERERGEVVHGVAEAGRLFYVACTRAEERLIFVHAPRKQKPIAEAAIHCLAPWGYTAEGCPSDGALPGAPDVIARAIDLDALPATRFETVLPEAPSHAERIERTAAVVARANARAHPDFSSPSGLRKDAEDRALESDLEPLAPPPSDTPKHRHARALGIALHDALERWDFRDAAAFHALVRSAARRLAAVEAIDAAALERETRALADEVLASELPGYLASADVVGRELPILFRDPDGTAWNGSIDLLYRDPDGRLVVADYKTDRAPDLFTRAHYLTQLATYARGVAMVFPGEPEPALELVWLRSGRRERVRLESSP